MSNVDPIFRHKFKDKTLIRLALTHRSSSGLNNERLEFLGDSILSSIVSEELLKKFPSAKEGELTKMRASLVNRKKLSQLASETDLKQFLILGEGEKKSGGWRRVSILANVLEAIIGAIFLDSSYENCRQLVKERFESSFKELEDKPLLKDPKTRLQEKLQSQGLALPVYTLDSIHGKDHDRTFFVKCSTSLFPPQIGQGESKKTAEQRAAEAVLCLIN